MSTKNQREQLIYSAIGNIATIVLVFVLLWIYILPRYESLSLSVDETNENIKKYSATANNGLTYAELDKILGSTPGKEELHSIIQSAPKETQEVIKKVGTEGYLTWLNKARTGDAALEEKEKVMIKKARLNSILPTFNPDGSTMTQNTISLRRYVSFIEDNILGKFNLESSAPLGIQNITYGKKGGSIPESLGSFDAELSFTSTNGNIIDMIEYINTLGHPEVLQENGTGTIDSKELPEIMSNPLVTIEEFSLQSNLDKNKLNENNTGRIVLRFFVRGSSTMDIEFLAGTINSKKEKLKSQIDSALKSCQADITCARKKELETLSVKYNEFIRATSGKKTAQGTEMMYILSSELKSINSMETELTNIKTNVKF